jgi:hypothetical protein
MPVMTRSQPLETASRLPELAYLPKIHPKGRASDQ